MVSMQQAIGFTKTGNSLPYNVLRLTVCVGEHTRDTHPMYTKSKKGTTKKMNRWMSQWISTPASVTTTKAKKKKNESENWTLKKRKGEREKKAQERERKKIKKSKNGNNNDLNCRDI